MDEPQKLPSTKTYVERILIRTIVPSPPIYPAELSERDLQYSEVTGPWLKGALEGYLRQTDGKDVSVEVAPVVRSEDHRLITFEIVYVCEAVLDGLDLRGRHISSVHQDSVTGRYSAAADRTWLQAMLNTLQVRQQFLCHNYRAVLKRLGDEGFCSMMPMEEILNYFPTPPNIFYDSAASAQ